MPADPAEQHPFAGIPQRGDVLVGKYRVERVLGIGGMGAVVAATHLQLEEQVAIKFLHAESAQNAESVTRFLREGKAVIKIRSEHAVKVHDVGRLESGAPYLVMEHLEGSDLSLLLAQRGPMPVTDAVDFVLQACEAVAEAHTLGIIHRDLKPANLFLTHRADGSPCVKVLDFGISKARGAVTDVAMTKTQAIMGSPRYMSPEQMRSTRTVDARTDVWSIGVILYELLSGHPPFNGESMTELCAQILQDAPTPLPRMLPQITEGLDAVVQRCLAKDPDLRFASLAELGTDLAPFGTASAQASAERIVRVMQARGKTSPTAGPPIATPASPGSASSPSSPRAVLPVTDHTAVSAPSAAVLGATTGSKGEKTSPRSPLGILWMVLVVGLLGGGVIFLRGHGATSASTTGGVAIEPPASAPSARPLSTEPSAPPPLLDAASSTPPPASSAPSVAIAATVAAPVKRPSRSAPPVSPAPPAGGMFDGRK